MISDYPNLWLLMGPNSVTGHSSVLFNTECTVNMMLKLLEPVFEKLDTSSPSPAPTVEVTMEAENEWYDSMRSAMEEKVWELGGPDLVTSSFALCSDLASLY